MNYSDPRIGGNTSAAAFLERLKRKNRTSYAAIHVFSFGEKDEFLEAIAGENSGSFTTLKAR